MSSFVRNRLIDKVYLPLFGDNLAKQMGTAGEQTRTDRMGLLLLLSPPGYGKTTLMEYIANRLGLIFMKINGPAIGHQVTSLAPQDANSMAAAKELEKLNLALEMGDNVMLYVDDIQHCHPEFLQKFISLCDAQRRIEGVYKGKAKTYDLRGSRFAVVMAGNPYTESGDRFQIPDMLANRADIYNLGDIIGDSAAAFKLSYLENALTSNSTLAQLAGKSTKDVHTLIQSVETGQLEGLEYEGSHSTQELADYRKVLQLLLKVRDVVLTVNQAYIRSAAMAEDYRTEPVFKLQGSYRNMNKLAEKIAPIMNESELRTLLLAHYEGEVQTLTADAEANFLKLKELLGWLSPEEAARWSAIKAAFRKKQRFGGADGSDRMAQVIAQMDAFNEGLAGIRQALEAE
jgi:MoxR-like ATPase